MKNVVVLFAVLLAMASPAATFAQGPDLKDERVSFEARSMDVREALKLLFKPFKLSYTISPDVQGTVMATCQGVPFETALQAILLQVDARYNVEAGVFAIEPKAAIPPVIAYKPTTPLEAPKVIRKISIRNADPALILRLLAGSQEMLSPWLNRNSGISASYSWGGFGGGIGGGSLGLSFGGGF